MNDKPDLLWKGRTHLDSIRVTVVADEHLRPIVPEVIVVRPGQTLKIEMSVLDEKEERCELRITRGKAT